MISHLSSALRLQQNEKLKDKPELNTCFTTHFSAVLQIFLSRRKAAVVLRKVAEITFAFRG